MNADARHGSGRIRVAIVGVGFGRYAIAPAFRLDPRAEIVALCARSPESLARARDELGVARTHSDAAEMLDAGGIDAVAIASPPQVQPPLVELALGRSLPVFAEKMLARTREEASGLVDAARAAGVANVVDYIFPEIPAWRECGALVEQGAVGTVRQVTVTWMMESYDNRHGLETWKTDSAAGGGVLQHFGSHVLHYLEWLMGPIAEVQALLRRAPATNRPGDTAVALALAFQSGPSGSVTLSSAAPGGSGHRIEISGSNGTLILANDTADPVRGFRLLHRAAAAAEWADLTPPMERELGAGVDSRVAPVSRIASRFLDWIESGRPTRPSFEDGLRVQELLEAVQRSDASGTRLFVPVS